MQTKDRIPVPSPTKGKMGGGGLGAGLGGALFAVIASYFGAQDMLLLAISTLGSIVGGAVGAYAVRNYITDPRVIELLRDLETQVGRGRTSIRSSWLGTVGAISLSMLMLSGCGASIDGEIDSTEQGIIDSVKLAAITALVSLNEAGVDPLQVPEEKLKIVRIGCDLVIGGIAVFNPDNPDIGEELSDFCEIFIAAAGPAG